MANNTSKHRFASAKIQGPDPTIIGPNEWNDEHVFTGGVDGDALVRDSSKTDGVSWGAAAATGGPLRVLNLQFPNVANSGTAEVVLATYTLPANYLAVVGKAISIAAGFTFGSSAGADSRIIRLYFGSQVISNFGRIRSGTIGQGTLTALVQKTGANTQEIPNQPIWTPANPTTDTNTVVGIIARVAGTQTDSAGIVIQVTGQNTVVAGTDVTCLSLLVEALN